MQKSYKMSCRFALLLCSYVYASDVHNTLITIQESCTTLLEKNPSESGDDATRSIPEVFCHIYPNTLEVLKQTAEKRQELYSSRSPNAEALAYNVLQDSLFYVPKYASDIFKRMDRVIALAKADKEKNKGCSAVREDIVEYAQKWEQLRAFGLCPIACALILNKNLFEKTKAVVGGYLDDRIITEDGLLAYNLCKAMRVAGYSIVIQWISANIHVSLYDYHHTKQLLAEQQTTAAQIPYDETQFEQWCVENNCSHKAIDQYLKESGIEESIEQEAIEQIVDLEQKADATLSSQKNSILWDSCQHYLMQKSAEFLLKYLSNTSKIQNWDDLENEMLDQFCDFPFEITLKSVSMCLQNDIEQQRKENNGNYDRSMFLERCEKVVQYILSPKHRQLKKIEYIKDLIDKDGLVTVFLGCLYKKANDAFNRELNTIRNDETQDPEIRRYRESAISLRYSNMFRDISWKKSLYSWMKEAIFNAIDFFKCVVQDTNTELYNKQKEICERALLEQYITHLYELYNRVHFYGTNAMEKFYLDVYVGVLNTAPVLRDMLKETQGIQNICQHYTAWENYNNEICNIWNDVQNELVKASKQQNIPNDSADRIIQKVITNIEDPACLFLDRMHEKTENIALACENIWQRSGACIPRQNTWLNGCISVSDQLSEHLSLLLQGFYEECIRLYPAQKNALEDFIRHKIHKAWSSKTDGKIYLDAILAFLKGDQNAISIAASSDESPSVDNNAPVGHRPLMTRSLAASVARPLMATSRPVASARPAASAVNVSASSQNRTTSSPLENAISSAQNLLRTINSHTARRTMSYSEIGNLNDLLIASHDNDHMRYTEYVNFNNRDPETDGKGLSILYNILHVFLWIFCSIALICMIIFFFTLV